MTLGRVSKVAKGVEKEPVRVDGVSEVEAEDKVRWRRMDGFWKREQRSKGCFRRKLCELLLKYSKTMG